MPQREREQRRRRPFYRAILIGGAIVIAGTLVRPVVLGGLRYDQQIILSAAARLLDGTPTYLTEETLEEAAYMRRKRITITTFMLAADAPLLEFVRKLTELNQGRIYETDPQNVGAYVFRDFVRNRRKWLH